MAKQEYKEKFIGFIDILGFKALVEASGEKGGMSLDDILAAVAKLGRPGPQVCTGSRCAERDLDFKVTQISDCAIISSEISPAGAINLISHCWSAVYGLLRHGLMCRGYITRGSIYHTEHQVIGAGYQNAEFKEKNDVIAFRLDANERGTPFVEIDSAVVEYIKSNGDECTMEIFKRFVKGDGNVYAVFPFRMMEHSFIVAGMGIKFEPEKEKESNNNMRKMLLKFKDNILSFVDKANPSAIAKVKHYLKALDNQLVVCDQIDENIEMLCSPFPRNRIKKYPR